MTSCAGHIAAVPHGRRMTASSADLVWAREWRTGTLGLAVSMTAIAVATSTAIRWHLARETLWQCDEIPLLLRFTGLAGQVANQAQAEAFQPTKWTYLSGVRRSVHVPRSPAALHTTTGFWANLSLHVFGTTPFAGRFFPFVFALAAIPIVAWAAWLVTRSTPAACLAAWFMALSPHGAAYGVQVRGYAEAMALAALMLVLFEYYRRQPDRTLRAVLVFLCAIDLSLTVFTSYVYWVMPVLLIAVWQIPLCIDQAKNRRTARLVLLWLLVGVASFMAFYTIDRWKPLTFSAGRFGDRFGSWHEVSAWLADFSAELTALPAAVLLLVPVGAVMLRRSPARVWLWMIGAGIMAPLIWTIFSGSPGFTRNLGYLVGPVAILFGIGAARAVGSVLNHKRTVPAVASLALLLGGATALGLTRLDDRARAILLPDWSAATRQISREPETVGPRWIAPCLAHHWEIDWYRNSIDIGTLFALPEEHRIEVAVGATLNREGQPRVFRELGSGSGIEEIDLPEYLRDVSPTSQTLRVEWRLWEGRAVLPGADLKTGGHAPMVAFFRFKAPVPAVQWKGFLRAVKAEDSGIVTFKAEPDGFGEIRSMVFPARDTERIQQSAQSKLELARADIRIFELARLSP